MNRRAANRVLVVSPVFHGYWRGISAALAAHGYETREHLYDQRTSIRSRVKYKVRHELPQRLGHGDHQELEQLTTLAAIRAVRESQPDVVVVVKGDALGDDFYSEISGRARVLWLYDELRRTRWEGRDISIAGPVCSYSPADTRALSDAGLTAMFLPLAYDHRLIAKPTPKRNADVVFIGARYPGREKTLVDLAAHGIPVRVYGRDWSHHVWDRLRTWEARRPALPSGRDLERAEAYSAMMEASATLNMHGDQDGFTMRTFEACGVGALQFIDRDDLNGLYDDGVDLASFSSVDELADLCRRATSDRAWSANLRQAARVKTLANHTFDHRVATLARVWT